MTSQLRCMSRGTISCEHGRVGLRRGKACWPGIDWENIRVDGTSSARLSERALYDAGHTSHVTRHELHYTN